MANKKIVLPTNKTAGSKQRQNRWKRRMAILGISKAESALGKRTVRLLEGLFNQSPMPIIALNLKKEVAFWNSAAEDLFGWTEDEVLGNRIPIIPPAQEADFEARFRNVLSGRQSKGIELMRRNRSGQDVAISFSNAPLLDDHGNAIGAFAFLEDITERKRIEEMRKQSERNFQQLIENSMDVVLVLDENTNVLYISPSVKNFLGCKSQNIIGQSAFAKIHPADVQKIKNAYQTAIEHPFVPILVELRLAHRDGSWRIAECLMRFLPGAKPGEGKLIINSRDVTKRRSSEEEIRKLSQALEQNPVAIVLTDPKGTIEYVNAKFVQASGYSKKELIGQNSRIVKSGHTLEKTYRELWTAITSGQQWSGELQNKRKNGEMYQVRSTISPLKNEYGQVTHFLGMEEDITEQKQLESQLRQAQKMESVGRLAGGIAHDFNNLLTSIIGLAQLILMELPQESPLRKDIEEIKATGDRAAQLTHQLLAFSRRQLVEPKYINLKNVIVATSKMLCRIIGEDIKLAFELENCSGSAYIDPSQIEQLIMNIAINARDAMPAGGDIKIRLSNISLDENFVALNHGAKRGDYILISISDTGDGMTDEVKAHIFEPFFTTKEKGKGTGLGLATCYGIVKQNNGYIAVESALGHGTTVRIYLPLAQRPAVPQKKEEHTVNPNGGNETVLIVEDETSLRNLAARILRKIGYNVLVASDGEEGLRVASKDSKKKIKLVIADMVMPKLGGKKMAELLMAERSDLKFIYTSGYTEENIFGEYADNPSIRFLRKPYTPEGIAKLVRETLNR